MHSFIYAFLIAVALLPAGNAAQAQSSLANWWPYTTVPSNPAVESASVALTPAAGNSLFAAWTGYTGGKYRVYGRQGLAGFSSNWPVATELIADAGSDAIDPVCAASGALLFMAWIERSNYNQGRIMFARKQGASWDAAQQISGFNDRATSLELVAAGTNVFLVWCDARTGTPNLYSAVSTDSGATWSAVKTITASAYYNWYPSLAISGNSLYLVWEDWQDGCGEVAFSQSADQAQTWSAPLRISFADKLASERPRIAAAADTLYVAWQEERAGGKYSIHLDTRAANGTWSGQRLTSLSLDARLPRISQRGSSLFVTWQSENTGSSVDLLYLLASPNAGQSWLPVAALGTSAIAGGSAATPVSTGAQSYLAWINFGSALPEIRLTMNPSPVSAISSELWKLLR